MRRLAQTVGFLSCLTLGLGAAVALGGGDHGGDKGHGDKTTVTVTETVTQPGETVTVTQTVPGPERVRTETVTVVEPAVTVVETQPAVTVTEPAVTVVETRTVKSKPVVKTVTRWRTRWNTRTVIRKVCKRPPPPCCQGSG